MWEQYKKNLTSTQLLILAVAVALLAFTRSWHVAARFFFVMQIGSVAGVMWGLRLRKRFFPNPGDIQKRAF